MNPFSPSPRTAFQPPSDMVGSGGGSSTTKKIFVGLGIGCGVVLLIVGLLVAAGALKTITCCNDMKKIADSSVGAEQFAGAFAQEIYEAKIDEAYARTTTAFQAGTDKAAFKAAVDAHADRMKSNQPRLFNMQIQQSGGDKPSLEQLANGSWMMSYQFAGPKDPTMLLLNFRVVPAPEGAERALEIDDVVFDERPRNLTMEPPAAEVMEVHSLIQKGQYELAYARLGDGFRENSDTAAWRAFLKDAGDVVTSSSIEIREVGYNDANTQATVMAHAKSTSGKDAIIQYELQAARPEMPGAGWRIVAIAPIVAESGDGTAEMPPITNAGSATNGAPGTTGAEKPSIDLIEVTP